MADETKPDKKTDVKPDKKPDSQPDGDKKPQHKVEDYEKPDKKPDSQPDGDKQPPNLRLKRPPKPLPKTTPKEIPIYEDTYLKWDKTWGIYVLSEQALQAIRDLRAEGKNTAEIEWASRHISQTVYSLLHANPVRANFNDELVKHNGGAREQLRRALLTQAEYMLFLGDLSFSLDENKRKMAISPSVREILSSPFNLIYMGV